MFNLFKKKVRTKDIVNEFNGIMSDLNKKYNELEVCQVETAVLQSCKNFKNHSYLNEYDNKYPELEKRSDEIICSEGGIEKFKEKECNIYEYLNVHIKHGLITALSVHWINQPAQNHAREWLNFIDCLTGEDNCKKYEKECADYFREHYEDKMFSALEKVYSSMDELHKYPKLEKYLDEDRLYMRNAMPVDEVSSILGNIYEEYNQYIKDLNKKYFIPKCIEEIPNTMSAEAKTFLSWALILEIKNIPIDKNYRKASWYEFNNPNNEDNHAIALTKYKIDFHEQLKKDMIEMNHPLADRMTFSDYDYSVKY